MRAPALNTVTMRHIVSAPTHVRAWRAEVNRSLNGPDWNLKVADDYDLCVRTFLATKCLHIPKMIYKQHISPKTAQRQHNALIQENVAIIAEKYRTFLDETFGVPKTH